ncbi:hypothetical protein BDZ45DRAFT_730780 [Acephala macrosclerotiorum]|nr:hypothetical protein BDZ45DRAFT_730780 [Acephala macrosclerotiorum]
MPTMSFKIKSRQFQLKEACTTEKTCVVFSRILLLSLSAYSIYQSFTKTTLEGDDRMLLLVLSSIFSTMINLCLLCGILSCPRPTQLQASMSREECLNILNTTLKSRGSHACSSWFIRAQVKDGKSGGKNRERESFASYLAGSYRGGAMVLYQNEGRFRMLVFQGVVILLLRLAISNYLSTDITYTYKLLFLGLYLMLAIFAFILGRHINWYTMMGENARKIKERCGNRDEENGDSKETLEWWIGVLLKDEEEDVRCDLGRSFLDVSKRSVLLPVSGSKIENHHYNSD